MRSTLASLLALVLIVGMAASAVAEETVIHVRVLAKGAKFIGTSMGGVHVVIRDAVTGEILAQGKTKGGTGDTKRIMEKGVGVHGVVATTKAAAFEAKLDLKAPRLLRFTARGPMAQAQGVGEVSATQWVVPGKHLIGGNGFLLELPGLVVDVLDPPAHVKIEKPGVKIALRANVVMMCGCHLTEDGPWPVQEFEVGGLVYRDGERIGVVALKYAGKASQYVGEVVADQPGAYEVVVYAYQRKNGNTGLDRTTFTVAKPKPEVK